MKIFILNVCLLMSFNSFAKGGDEVRNGGGLAEQYLAFALENLGGSIDICLAKPACGKDEDGRAILAQIKDILPQEKKSNILRFESERKRPGFFLINGVVRLAVTGSKVGDPIYYNLDLLYQNNQAQMTYGQAIQTLVHELGHHLGLHDHDILEVLGAEVRSANEGSVNDVVYLPALNRPTFSAVATERKSFFEDGSLSLIFTGEVVSLNHHFNELLGTCSMPNDSIVSSAVQFFNLHWDHDTSGIVAKGDRILAGNVILYCKFKRTVERRVFSFRIAVTTYTQKDIYYVMDKMMSRPKFLFSLSNDSIIVH